MFEGQYIDGQKHGIWIRRLTSQTVEETWDRGVRKYSHGRKPEFEHFTGIDVGACIPQSLHFELPFGSAYYTVVGRASGACEVRTGGIKERGQLGLQVCRFPSAMGRVPYQLGDRILFGAAEKYCEQHPPPGVPLWQRP